MRLIAKTLLSATMRVLVFVPDCRIEKSSWLHPKARRVAQDGASESS
jgi:hypothetical protein